MDFSPLLTLLISSVSMIMSAATAFIVAWFESKKRRFMPPESEIEDVTSKESSDVASKE